jgi:nucleoside-diphosphate-sugar epimerase
MPVLPQDAVLTQGSTILVTGGNGYISSHVIDQLLNYG